MKTPDYISSISDEVINPKLNHNKIAASILEEHKLIYSAGDFFEYSDGYYKRLEDQLILQGIKSKIGDKFSSKFKTEVLLSLSTDVFIPVTQLNSTHLLNLKNGFFDISNLTLSPHMPEIYSTIRLNVNYIPGCSCDLWVKTITEIFEGNTEKVDLLQEFFGLCLTRETKFEKALLLVGEGANGKSTILSGLQAFLGPENYTAIPLERFDDPHYISSLFGKLANISIETNAKSQVYDSVFKAIVSGDPVTVDPKYRNPFTFSPFCKLIFAVNGLPRVEDKTDAFFRRLLILRFNRQFAENEQNKTLKTELLKELDGIFLWALEGLKRLRERGYFILTDEMGKAIEEYRQENNSLFSFVEEICKLDLMASVSKAALYLAYSSWCKDNGYKPLNKKRFGMELIKRFRQVKDFATHVGRIWEGITIEHSSITKSFTP